MLTSAKWIRAAGEPASCPVFGRKFTTEKAISHASLTITARGVFEAHLNGVRVSGEYLAPGWTEYESRILVREYDVTSLLGCGENMLTVSLASGWYAGVIRRRSGRGAERIPAIIAELTVSYADGGCEVIPTDESWKWSESGLARCDIYDGQYFDARTAFAFDGAVRAEEFDKSVLVPHDGLPVTVQERIAVRKIFTTPAGETVLDFGQNITGVPAISLCAHAGDTVKFSFAEIMDPAGNFYTENYREAKCEFTYICREGEQTYMPSLTFYGFRYLRVDAFPGEITPENVTAVVLNSDMKRTGFIETGDAMVNRLMENVIWGQKGNYLDIPTDCPQRNERLGWTGDAQVFVKAAAYNFDVKAFFTKWLRDMACAQLENGLIPKVIPDALGDLATSAAWGDAGVICPWQIYMSYGDRKLLAEHYPMMRAWADYITSVSDGTDLWPGGGHYGDWLGLDAAYGDYRGRTDPDLISAAYYAYASELVAKAAAVLGYTEDAEKYAAQRERIGAAFYAKYQDKFETQTAYALALHFGLAKDPKAVGDALAARVHEDGDRLMTGFVGTPYLLHALSAAGYADLAYTLFLKRDFPSWLYPITKGATTMWEHWDGIMPDGQIWSKAMNSFNHYAYGAVADWVYEYAAGIRPLQAGFAKIAVDPHPDRRLGSLHVRFASASGDIAVKWAYDDEGICRVRIETAMPAVIRGEEVPAGVYEYYI
ncbi:MAG: alfa-L-rhamnosidase [Ruminococcaceae bacterium]|nr:alfa-L-rhamnosidase [Oscillospiraceae bacterium]